MINVKPGDLKGSLSYGRMFIASDGKTKEIVRPPNGAKIGEQIKFNNVQPKVDDEGKETKLK